MWGVEFEDPAMPGRLAEQLLREGLLLLPAGTRGEVLSFTPPFGISREEIDYCGERLRDVVRSSRSAPREIVPISSAERRAP